MRADTAIGVIAAPARRAARALFCITVALGVVGGIAVADSFMSSTEFVAKPPAAGQADLNAPVPELGLHEMLAAMQWKERDDLPAGLFDLGNGVYSPRNPQRALLWCASTGKAVGPSYHFLALYKANWNATNGDLLAEMQKIKTELAFRKDPDTARQAVMALGVALAALQVNQQHTNPGPETLAVRYASAMFAEAILHTRSLGQDTWAHSALGAAIRSAWAYIKLYPGPTAAIRRLLLPDAVVWLETPTPPPEAQGE